MLVRLSTAVLALGLVSSLKTHVSGPQGSVCWHLVREEQQENSDTSNEGDAIFSRHRSPGAWSVSTSCCEGYKEIIGSCRPVCSPECIHGTCTSPNECTCDEGYVPHEEPYRCVPLCTEVCTFGKCTAPETCTCNEGYQLEMDGHTCDPVCSKPCTNGHCAQPNFCECDSGYKFQESTLTCEPVCTSLCPFGKCTNPETCTCNEGYEMNEWGNTCKPVCNFTCENGWCERPNVCECFQGYTIDATVNTCYPACERPCVNGRCIGPDKCACNDGMVPSKHDVFTCEAKCTEPCTFGTCTAPDTCTCLPGYEKSTTSNSVCVPSCHSSCKFGECIAPNTCKCNAGFIRDPKNNGSCVVCDVQCVHGTCTLEGCICEFGWNGEFCDQPVLCYVRKPRNDTIPENDIKSYAILNSNSGQDLELDIPVCHPECSEEANETSNHYNRTTATDVFYFIPIYAECNRPSENYVVDYRKDVSSNPPYVGIILGVLIVGIIMLVIIGLGIRCYRIQRARGRVRSTRLIYVPDSDEQDMR